jgi:hypothetical protein
MSIVSAEQASAQEVHMFAQNIACRAAVAKASLRLPRASGCREIILAKDIVADSAF